MRDVSVRHTGSPPVVVSATDEAPIFPVGNTVQVLSRAPIGHYRVPRYLRGHTGVLERVVTLAS